MGLFEKVLGDLRDPSGSALNMTVLPLVGGVRGGSVLPLIGGVSGGEVAPGNRRIPKDT